MDKPSALRNLPVKTMIGWILVGAAGWGVSAMLPLEPAARQCFAIVLAGIGCLIFGLLPSHVVGMWIVTLPVILNLTPPEISLKAATQWSWWIFLTGFFIGMAFNKTGLGKRLGLYFGAYLVKGWYSAILAIFLMNVFFNIAAPFSGAAAIAIGISIFIPMAGDMGYAPGSRGFNGMALACVTSNLIAGELVLTGWILNPFAVSLFAPVLELDFFSWIQYITLPAAFFLLAAYVAISFAFRPEKTLSSGSGKAREQLQALAQISSDEWRALVLTLMILFIFITQPLHGLEAGWLAVGASFLFFVPGCGVLDIQDLSRDLPWHFMIFLLGIFSIGYQLTHHDIHLWLAGITLPRGVETWPPVPANVFIALIMTLMHFLVGSMVPLLASFVPTLTAYADAHGMSVVMIFGTVLFAAKRWVFPFQEAFVLMTRGLTGGLLGDRAVIFMGIILSLLVIFVVIPVSTMYWHLIGAP